MPPATMSCRLCQLAQPRRGLDGKALHHSFAVHVRVEKCRGIGLKLRNRLVRRQLHLRLPSLHGNAPVLRVDPGHHALRAHARGKLRGELRVHRALCRKKRRPDDHALRACIQHLPRALDGVNAAARLARAAAWQSAPPARSCRPAASPRPGRSAAPAESARNFSIQYSKSSNARRSFSPCTSCTMRPPSRSIEGISMAASPERLPAPALL